MRHNIASHFLLCVGILAATALASCNNYLDIKPYGKEIPKTAEDFSALIHYMCNQIDEGSNSTCVGSMSDTEDFEAFADNMEASLETNSLLPHYIGDKLGLDAGTGFQNYYTSIYEDIRTCNIVLGELHEGLDTREAQDILSTAYAIRGVCYYQLLRQFCAPPLAADGELGVPIVTEFDMEARPARSSMEATIEQARTDLERSLAMGQENDFYLFTPDVVRGYLARLHHWCGHWQEARAYALQVLDAHPLVEGDTYTGMIAAQYGLVGNRLLMANRISTSFNSISAAGIMSSLETRPLSASYTSLFEEGTRDVRARGNLYRNRKRKNRKLPFTGMRSAEMAFIAMESAYHLGDETTALAELNAFRRLRIDDYEDLTVSTLPAVDTEALMREDALGQPLTPLLQAILRERRKEFYLENCDRWFELKRNGRPEWWTVANGQKYWTRRYMYTFPFPLADIQLQPAIVQNPGYENVY